MMNKKGFTLIELLATIIVLSIVMGIGAYSIINILNSSKKKNYDILIDNINSGAEQFYQECTYSSNEIVNSSTVCRKDGNGNLRTNLGTLVEYGYIKGNDSDKNTKKFSISNPLDKVDISNCEIMIYFDGNVNVSAITGTNTSCPTSYSDIKE